MLLSIGLVLVCLGVIAGVVAAAFPRGERSAARSAFLRTAVAAGVVSLGAASLVVMGEHGAGRVVSIASNTALVLTPGLMCVAVSTTSRRRARGAAVFAATASLLTALGSIAFSASAAIALRSLVLVVVCAVCAVLAMRNDSLPHRSMRLIAVAMVAYAMYSAGRTVTTLASGATPDTDLGPFSMVPAALVAVVVNLLTGAAVLLVAIAERRATRLCTEAHSTVVIGDVTLVASAFGVARTHDLVNELRLAARELDPSAVDVPHGIATRRSGAVREIGSRLNRYYGWRHDELLLLRVAHEEASR
ncbi:hypothetical protein Q9R20_12150 [Microbacterium sp. PRF11]|uniref:hypothetical protein n=1 Tax=Microbacterium sp. PRF11 TaxID=2962593 RepID=UPI002881F4C2|nr:hypothetical protein [Microbacterium sp. PRF11]MDT0117741.1 hypothetical protein [Microbacterium sp. PRF11]